VYPTDSPASSAATSEKAKKPKKPGKKTALKEKRIMGWVENVYLLESSTKLKAKLDTGAKTSSIHAENIERFSREGENWVRFDIKRPGRKAYVDKDGRPHPEKPAVSINFERPEIRTAKIKRHKNQSMERPVVLLAFMIGGRTYESEFTLTDRRKFIYPVLLGRRFLRKVAIIDPGKTFLTSDSAPKDTNIPSQGGEKDAKILLKVPSQK